MATTFVLLIIYRDGEIKEVHGVSDYKFSADTGLFSYEKNGYRSFVPKEAARSFGRKSDYTE